ncbi:MAG TPA: glycosyltransferase family 2 protein [Planctomycetota bacterium]|jgi:GT2 family glycosyltransferase
MSRTSVGVVIVTYNSGRFLPKALEALQRQSTPPQKLVVVDNASSDRSYLSVLDSLSWAKVLPQPENLGFCRGNNIGAAELLNETDFILFLNPDAFLTPAFIEKAVARMQEPGNENVGALTGVLLGYDIEKDAPTGRLDSTGIFRTWYGRWYDRGQRSPAESLTLTSPQPVSAICGAAMFCRSAALRQVLLNGREVFDERFFMYKEDIDLSLRLARAGWRLMLFPELQAYHCRGWTERKAIPMRLRVLSARNDLRVHWRDHSPCCLYALAKLLYVYLLER